MSSVSVLEGNGTKGEREREREGKERERKKKLTSPEGGSWWSMQTLGSSSPAVLNRLIGLANVWTRPSWGWGVRNTKGQSWDLQPQSPMWFGLVLVFRRPQNHYHWLGVIAIEFPACIWLRFQIGTMSSVCLFLPSPSLTIFFLEYFVWLYLMTMQLDTLYVIVATMKTIYMTLIAFTFMKGLYT